MGLFDVTNPRDTYADKILREASVNRTENRRQNTLPTDCNENEDVLY